MSKTDDRAAVLKVPRGGGGGALGAIELPEEVTVILEREKERERERERVMVLDDRE